MLQIIEISEEDQIKMYSKLSKKEIIKMLIEANKHLNRIQPKVMSFNNSFNEYKPIISKEEGSSI